MTRRWWAALAVAAAAAATACGPADAPRAGQSIQEAEAEAAGKVGTEEKIDACALLTDDEVTGVIKEHSEPTRDGVGGASCSWENEETYHSVTVRIGLAGSAPGGELPATSIYGETEPAPDGMRYAPGNVIEFAVGDRACEIQVVTNPFDDSDRPVEVRFAGLVRDRI